MQIKEKNAQGEMSATTRKVPPSVTSINSEHYAPMLVFDLVSSRRLQELQDLLVSSGYTAARPSGPPHVTLGVTNHLEIKDYASIFSDWAAQQNSFPLILRQFGRFPNVGALYLSPGSDTSLAETQKRFHKGFQMAARDTWRYYEPDMFTPHMSLGTEIAKEALDRAQQLISAKITLPITVQVVGACVLKVPTQDELLPVRFPIA